MAAPDTLGHNSDGVGSHWRGVPRVARKLAILGFVAQSRDCGALGPRFEISKENAPNNPVFCLVGGWILKSVQTVPSSGSIETNEWIPIMSLK